MSVIRGTSSYHLLKGTSSNDTIYDGPGTDTMIGGKGNDTYYVNNSKDVITENSNEGFDIVYSSVSYTLPANVEELILTGTAILTAATNNSGVILVGNSGKDTLYGGGGRDTLIAGTGIDTMIGVNGNNTYFVNNSKDVIIGHTNDTIYSNVSYTMPSNIKNLILTGSSNLAATGNSLNDTITANSGNDTLISGTAIDTLIGGAGKDTYYIYNSQDIVIGHQNDIIYSNVSYTLPFNVNNLILTGSSNLTATGNNLNNTLTANSGNDTLISGAGKDTLIGGAGKDTYYIYNSQDIVNGHQNDTIYSNVSYTLPSNVNDLILTGSSNLTATGNNLNDTITANSGNDTLNSGTGIDTLIGGAGKDTYYIYNSQDIVNGHQNDTIYSNVSYALASNIKKLILTGSSNLTATGNNQNDTISSNSGNDTLISGTGIDTYFIYNSQDIVIGNQDDTIYSNVSYTLPSNLNNLILTGSSNLTATGNNLNDTLTSNSGNDTLISGTGKDTYFINNSQDIVIGNQYDTIYSNVSYTLPSNVNNLILTGSSNLTATGNNLNDTITSNSGKDTLIGGTGNNNYFINNSQDIVIGNQNDTIYSNISYTLPSNLNNLILTGSSNLTTTGNNLNDTITANSGNDTIISGTGNDTYIFNANLGQDTIINATGNNTINFGAGIYQSNLNFTQSNNDLLISINNSNSSILISNWFNNSQNQIEQIRFSDGSSMSNQDINNSISTVSTVNPPDSSWITSSYLKDIYTREFPRVMGNQWEVDANGMFDAANNNVQTNDDMINFVANYLDYIVLNCSDDLFLDNYDSSFNPNMGLLKTKDDIYNAASAINRRVYVLPYLNMTDVWTYESVLKNPNWTYWQSQQDFNGQNFGSWDYANANNLFVTENGKVLYYANDTNRPLVDATNPLWQQYYVNHVMGILSNGYDGIFTDNWARSAYTGGFNSLTSAQFLNLQKGWNTIGGLIENAMDNDPFLVGNSPPYSLFTSRDVCMLEDRVANVLGTADKSIAAYLNYSNLGIQSNQVVQDTYWDESYGPFETFRLPINLLTDNILGIGNLSNDGTSYQTFAQPLETLGKIGYPLEDRTILPGSATGIKDTIGTFSLDRAIQVRYYTYGVDYLNNSGSEAVIILPSGNWLRSDGQQFTSGDFVTLDDCSGWVFKKTDNSPLSDNDESDTFYSSSSYTLGTNYENLVLTGSSNINAIGNNSNNILIANMGNDILSGGLGDDSYVFLSGFDKDTVINSGGNDTIKFGTGLSKDNITFNQSNDNLVIGFNNSNSSINVNKWFDGNQYQIEEIKFYNGDFLTNSDINKIIQQMATFSAESMSHVMASDNNTNQNQQLNNIIMNH